MDEILKYHHSNESYLAVLFGGTVTLTVLFNVVLTFFNLSVEKTLNVKCDDSNEGYAVLSFLHSIQCKYNEYSSLSN